MNDILCDLKNQLQGGGKWAYNTTLTNLSRADIDRIKKFDKLLS